MKKKMLKRKKLKIQDVKISSLEAKETPAALRVKGHTQPPPDIFTSGANIFNNGGWN